MAASELNGVNYEIAENFDPATEAILAKGLWGGKLRVCVDNKTVNAIEADSTINIAKLPKGATFLFALIRHGALGTSVTLKLGDSGVADRYMAAVASATAGVKRADAIAGFGYSVTAETIIVLKTAGATTASSDIDIKTEVFYTVE